MDCEDSKLLHWGILNILISKKIGILPQMISIIIILKTCYREFNTFSSLIKLTNGWNFLLCSLLKILTMQLLCFFPVVCSIIESCFFFIYLWFYWNVGSSSFSYCLWKKRQFAYDDNEVMCCFFLRINSLLISLFCRFVKMNSWGTHNLTLKLYFITSCDRDHMQLPDLQKI